MKSRFLALLVGFLLVLPLVAEASFHVMSIREVYAGSHDNPNSQYVMLQMRSNGQNQLSGHKIVTYDAIGNTTGTYTFSSSVASGVSQRFVLIATPEAVTQFGVSADLVMSATVNPAGGRICFDNIDCFAWGSYSGSSTLPGTTTTTQAQCQTSTPFMVAEGLVSGRAARRDISAGNPSLLETSDDTGSSSNDFDYAPIPAPTNNAGISATPPAIGSGFDFVDFTDVSALRLNGSTSSTSGMLRLTPIESSPNRGSVWHLLHQPIASGFDTTFQFRITQSGGVGADGFTFTLHNESNSSLGEGSSGLGYADITNSIAVEFDTYFNNAAEIGIADPYEGDPSNSSEAAENHISIHSAGNSANSASEAFSYAVSASLPQIADGSIHAARVVYVPGTLQVYVDNLDVPVARGNITIPSLLQLYSNAGFVGFTSASGSEDHDILNWQFGTASVDTTPTIFNFTNQPDVPTNTLITSESIVVGGINSPSDVSIIGGEYSITPLNGVAGAFTSSNGIIGAGDHVTVRHTSAATSATSTNTTLTIGGIADTFTSTTAATDTTPNAFSFTPQTNVPTSSLRFSNLITISGINAPAAISVSAGSAYKIGSCSGGFMTGASTISNGQTVCVRHTSSATPNTTVTTTLTIGGVAGTFQSTTASNTDTTPNAFSFTPQTNVPTSSLRFSNLITISGINAPAAISVSAGSAYKIGSCSGGFMTGASTISNGQTVCVRHTSSATPNTTVTTTLTIGGVAGTFQSTTASNTDTTPNAFSFTPQTNVPTSSLRFSNLITISGINAPAAISVSAGSAYKIGSCSGGFMTGASTISNGQTVCVRHTSSATPNTTVTTTLTIGGVAGTFQSTTTP